MSLNFDRIKRAQILMKEHDMIGIMIMNYDDYIYFRASTPGFSSFVVFFSQCNCDPNVRKCEKGTVQLCVGNATWVVTETCDWDCKNGECTAPSDFERVIELFIPTLTIVGVSGGSMIVLFVLWSFVKRKFRKKKS